MFSKEQIIGSIAQEHTLIKHLVGKLDTPEQLAYRPNEHQRTVEELLQYIARMTLTMGTMIQDKQSTSEKNK